MPSFPYPPSAGGGGGGGVGDPVTGGSGTGYASIAAGIAGETETVVADVTGAGTAAGVVVGTGALSPADDFYKDSYLVLTDPTPGDGLVCRYARVASYIGATKTFTLDQPWDFGVGETYQIINPIRLAINRDLIEDAAFTKNVEFNLAGHRLLGKIDQTVGSFCWIRGGGGYVTNGVEKTNLGVLRIDDCTVSRREDTIYAVLMTSGSDLGRCELVNSRLFGDVAGRRGRAGWKIVNCVNSGIADPAGGVPYRLVESVAGVAVVVSQFDAEIDSEFSGAFFFSENSLTGATAYISIQAAIRPQQDFFGITTNSRRLAIARGVGGATLTLTTTTGTIDITHTQVMDRGGASPQVRSFAFGAVQDFTGTFSFLMSAPGNSVRWAGVNVSASAALQVEGTVAMSGSATVGGTAGKRVELTGGGFAFIALDGPITGTATLSGSFWSMRGTASYNLMAFTVSQTVGAPTVTVSAITFITGLTFGAYSFSTGITVSVGTYVTSGIISATISANIAVFNLTSAVTGGTWTVSGQVEYFDRNQFGATSFFAHAGTGGTMTVSNAVVLNQDGRAGSTIALVRVTSTGTINVTSATVLWRHYNFNAADVFIVDVTAAGVGSVTGAVTLEDCLFQGTATALSAVAGGTATGPSSLTFENCIFRSSLTDAAGAGVITWAAATWRLKNCHLDGLFTFVGTRFSTMEAFETFFNGDIAGESISATGVRPVTYRLWACYARASVFDLKPEVIRDWISLPSAAVLTRGNLVQITGVPDVAAETAGGVLDGVLLFDAGVAGNAVVVRDGEVFVDTNAVAAGDYLIVDAAGVPTRAITAALAALVLGQTVGRALEATGATNVGESYSSVRAR